MAERPDYTRRVDEVFARAVEEQLSEQRELTRLLSRVDDALSSVRDEMAELSARVVDSTAPVAETVAQTRTSVLTALEGLEESTASGREVSAAELGRVVEALEALRADLEARPEDGPDPGIVALDAAQEALTRQTRELAAIRDGLTADGADRANRLQELLDRSAQAQSEALTRIGRAADALQGAQAAGRDELSRAVREAVDAVRDTVGEATDQQTAALTETVEEVRRGAEALHERTADVAAAVTREAERVRGGMAAGAEEVARSHDELLAAMRSTVGDEIERLRLAVEQSADQLSEQHAGATLRLEQLAARLAAAADEVTSTLSEAGPGWQARLVSLLDRLDRLADQLDTLAAGQRQRVQDDAAAAAALGDRSREQIESLLLDLAARGEAAVDGMAVNAQRILDALGAAAGTFEQRLDAAAARLEQLEAAGSGPTSAAGARRGDVAALTCRYCGFVARTPGVLAAHRHSHH